MCIYFAVHKPSGIINVYGLLTYNKVNSVHAHYMPKLSSEFMLYKTEKGRREGDITYLWCYVELASLIGLSSWSTGLNCVVM